MMHRLLVGFIGLALSFFALEAQAHKPSDSYMKITVDGAHIEGQWDVALRDLDFAIIVDANDDGKITWGELRARNPAMNAYLLQHLQFSVAGVPCTLTPTGNLVDNHTDGTYDVLRFSGHCPRQPTVLEIRYTLFADLDPQHHGLLRLDYKGHTQTAVFSPERAQQDIKLGEVHPLQEFLAYARDGVWHIWTGYDHILFLLALLLPAVLRREDGHWRVVAEFRPAFFNVLKIVTAYTLAHSITLSLAALQIISLPSRFVESTIAASIVVGAANNIYPVLERRLWIVAFTFGLIHGFGFASVLMDLGLPQGALLVSLVGFNLGVEAGQIAIVASFLPLAFLVRRSWFYQPFTLVAGSSAIVVVAGIWMFERMLDFKVLPF